ncbi:MULTISPECIES: PqqD family protein [unclassified Saccharicrinis]|uniref:PqqD family protein n=1 Tax=unclassified Saccharicrinis TaxID=2646859 RepID=UPI003D354DA3
MKIRSNISISESGFVFDAKTGESFSLNPTGREILQLINLGKNDPEIKEYMMTKYEVSENILDRHLDDFVQMLRLFNLAEIE